MGEHTMLILQKFLSHPQLTKGAAQWDSTERMFVPANDIMPHVLKLIKEAHLIVIDDPDAGLQANALQAVFGPDIRPLAPPFPICWIEVIDSKRKASPLLFAFSTAHPIYRIIKMNCNVENDVGQHEGIASPWVSGHLLPRNMAHIQRAEDGLHAADTDELIEKRQGLVAMLGALVHERSPGRYDVFTVEVVTANLEDAQACVDQGKFPMIASKGGVFVFTEDSPLSANITIYKNVDPYAFTRDEQEGVIRSSLPTTMGTLLSWLRIINEGAMATEDTPATVRMPRVEKRHKSRPHPIRRIVRILPKRMYHKDIAPATVGGVVHWSHRWEVRGHWRRVKGIGKDRAGDYNVVGYTWVLEFVKGPEDMPLIVKTRVLHNPSGVPHEPSNP